MSKFFAVIQYAVGKVIGLGTNYFVPNNNPYKHINLGSTSSIPRVDLTYMSFDPLKQKDWENFKLNQNIMDSVLNPATRETLDSTTSGYTFTPSDSPSDKSKDFNRDTQILDDETAKTLEKLLHKPNIIGSGTLENSNMIAYVGIGLLALFILKD